VITPRRERYKIFEHDKHIGYFNIDYSVDGRALSADLHAPSESFVLLPDETGHVNHKQIKSWLYDRIVPPTRIGIDDLLLKMGHSEYDQLSILKYTSAKNTSDTCSIDFSTNVLISVDK
jgi:hypothetical protein